MGFLDIFGKKDVSGEVGIRYPYSIRTEFVPYKLRSRDRSSTTLIVNLKNLTGEPVMGSVAVTVPGHLSLDAMGLQKEKEVKLGMMGPNEEKESRIEIYGGVATEKGEYTITITSFVHYRDYAHILNSMKKRVILESV